MRFIYWTCSISVLKSSVLQIFLNMFQLTQLYIYFSIEMETWYSAFIFLYSQALILTMD